MRASLATIPRPQGISSDAVCVSFSPSAFTFDTEPHNQLCNLASFDATLTPRTNSHAREMYYQRFVGLSAQLCEKQGQLTSTSSSRRAATTKDSQGLVALRRSLSRRVALMRIGACAALCRVVLALGWNSCVSLSLLASLESHHRRLGHARSRARARSRRLAHRRRFWRTATRAREGVAQRRV